MVILKRNGNLGYQFTPGHRAQTPKGKLYKNKVFICLSYSGSYYM